MFLTDIPDSCSSSPTPPPSEGPVGSPSMDHSLELIPFCFLVSHNPLLYSLASQRAVEKIRQLATIIGEDPGKHGVEFDFSLNYWLELTIGIAQVITVSRLKYLNTYWIDYYDILYRYYRYVSERHYQLKNRL